MTSDDDVTEYSLTAPTDYDIVLILLVTSLRLYNNEVNAYKL